MDKQLYKHFVITRFNIKTNFSCSLKNPDNNPMERILDDDYLNERFNIFEKYTLESIKNQTNLDFKWIVLFHEDTPKKYKKTIKNLQKKFNFIDIYYKDNQKFNFIDICKKFEKYDYYITTRLDNDDMLSKDYIEKIQEYANNNLHDCIITFKNGIKFDLKNYKKYKYERTDNHFLSMISSKNESIMKYNHSKIFESKEDIIILDSINPMWTEVVHDSNVKNRIKVTDKEIDNNIKILVSDYDQTFYLNDEDIEKNKQYIEKFRNDGNIFVIATGRSYFDFKNKVDIYNIKYDYVIINHGATMLDQDDNIFVNFSINDNVIDNIKEDLHLDKSIKYFCCSKLESRVNFNHKEITKIHSTYSSKEQAMAVSQEINNKYFNYVNAYYVSINAVEIISNKTNKSDAINLLLEKLDLLKNNVYTIGDGYSDIEMIKNFNGYAMKKSVNELKQIATKEYDSVSDLINELM